MSRPISKGSQWRNEDHRLDVLVVEATKAVVKIKPVTRRGYRAKHYLVPVDDFVKLYRPKAA